MVKNKVVIKERDVWSDLANFIGEMVAKYAEAMELSLWAEYFMDYLWKKACGSGACNRNIIFSSGDIMDSFWITPDNQPFSFNALYCLLFGLILL